MATAIPIIRRIIFFAQFPILFALNLSAKFAWATRVDPIDMFCGAFGFVLLLSIAIWTPPVTEHGQKSKAQKATVHYLDKYIAIIQNGIIIGFIIGYSTWYVVRLQSPITDSYHYLFSLFGIEIAASGMELYGFGVTSIICIISAFLVPYKHLFSILVGLSIAFSMSVSILEFNLPHWLALTYPSHFIAFTLASVIATTIRIIIKKTIN
jgi:hypothetical protein